MAGRVLNFTIFTKSTAHALRALSLATFPPAFLLLLIQGVLSHYVLPALGLIPLFLSSGFSALLLANQNKCGCRYSGLTGTPIHLVFDVVLGTSLLVLLILTWINLPTRHGWGGGGLVILATYGTNFLIFNFLVHAYFVAQQLNELVSSGANFRISCPECQNAPFTTAVTRGIRGGYESLLNGDGEPRVGVDDERGHEADSVV